MDGAAHSETKAIQLSLPATEAEDKDSTDTFYSCEDELDSSHNDKTHPSPVGDIVIHTDSRQRAKRSDQLE